MSKILFVILSAFLVSTNVLFSQRIPQFAGPWRAIIERIDNGSTKYNSTGQIWLKAFFTHPKGRELQYVWGAWYSSIDVSDTLLVEIHMATRSNNQWKKNAFVMKFDKACSTSIFHSRWLVQMIRGKVEKCPHRATGLTYIKNQTVNPVYPQFPVFPYGHWLYTLFLIKGNDIVGVIEAECKTIPRV